MHLLIADDSKILQERILDFINQCSFVKSVNQAFNTNEAKSILKEKNKINVVITDIRMPGGGGLELLQFIKENYPSIKTIIITNYPYPQYNQKAKEIGAEYFLSKSDDLDQLVNVLNEISKKMDNR
jgi:two-component system response regulator YesN